MKGAPELVLIVFVVVIARLGQSTSTAGRKLVTSINPDFISIDCGVADDYIDEGTGIAYQSDRYFVDTGENYEIFSDYVTPNPYYERQLKHLRSFPQGTRNCYTLKPIQGKNNTYLIRAFFQYGNYDNKNKFPKFDVYIGVNYWTTMKIDAVTEVYWPEIIHVPSSDIIFVCLVNTGYGVPFISALELRHLDNSSYRIESGELILLERFDLGVSSQMNVRYKDDVFDRLWYTALWPDLSINTSSDIDMQGSKDGYDSYELPATVLRTALVPQSGYSEIEYSFIVEDGEYYVYLHFAEIDKLAQSQKREFNIYWNGKEYLKGPITLDYLKPLSISLPNTSATGKVSLNLTATTGSELPPILNALEIYRVVPLPLLPTEPEDVIAIMDIKQTYKINNDTWQGDPCVPSNFSWNNLTCSSDNIPRIISLNLSSSQLKGEIATSLSNLRAIQSLDLSYNELSGLIPEFFAQLPNLTFLNLSGNSFSGSIPQALLEKSMNQSLELRLDDNPHLCLTDSCNIKPAIQKTHIQPPIQKTHILIVVLIVLGLLIILGAVANFWRIKKKRQGDNLCADVFNVVIIKSKNRMHSCYSDSEVKSITGNFKNIIAEGGFGKVYRGTLKNGAEVAVKLLSPSSNQGHKELTKARLLMEVHHRNLVSLVGYCDRGKKKALIYEYMANGNLQQKLSVTNTNVLNWNQRLKIAVDAAQGLEYLHNGCRLPIIHRDLKTSNILLNERMQAKIANFGLSRAFPTEGVSHVTTNPAGTFGYIDPQSESANKENDVYSFGVILLELITGHPAIIRRGKENINILHWVRQFDEGDIQNIFDPRLQGEFKTNSAKKVVKIALSCTLAANERPNMSDVLGELKECLALEMAHGRTQMTVTDTNKTTSSNSFKTTFELESAMIPHTI